MQALKRIAAAAAWLALVAAPMPAPAQELRVAQRADVAVDPHFLFLGSNMAMSRHLFDALVGLDEDSRRRPGLALSWRPVDEKTWEFKLRPGVKFHDGSEFTAADVIFTINRIPNIPANPNPYTPNIRTIVGVEAADPLTVLIRTDRPNPALPGQLTNVFIVSHKAAAGAAPADFASGKAAIGTGPFRFSEYRRAERMVLERNDAYWGEKPVWSRVTFLFIPNAAARMAALMAGDVSLIDGVPPSSIEQLEKNANTQVFRRVSDRVMYIWPNGRDAPLPLAIDKAGNPLPRNPFADARVRRAVSRAIDRELLVARGNDGLGVPNAQLVPEGFGTYDPALVPEKPDLEGARRLLAEAGYPEGFRFQLACTNDQYVNDARICQALGQMIQRIGLDVQVEAVPTAVLFPRIAAPRSEVPMVLLGIASSSTGDAIHSLTSMAHTHDRERGLGAQNLGNFSNAKADELIRQGASTIDDAARDRLLRQAMRLVVADEAGILPLYTQMTIWGARRNITYTPRMNEQFVVLHAKPN